EPFAPPTRREDQGASGAGVGGRRDTQEFQNLQLRGGQGGLEDLDQLTGAAEQPVEGRAVEDLQHPGGARGSAGPVLGVERDGGRLLGGHGLADLPFDERLDEQGDEVAAQQTLDARRILQEHWGHQLGALELGVPAFQVRLVLGGGQQLGGGQVPVVGDEGEAAVGGGVDNDLVLPDRPGQAEVVADDLAVGGLGSGPATALLPDALL